MMEDYKKEFIEFLIRNNALKFGEFTLKSGRISPYFINIGSVCNGGQINKVGEIYAKTIIDKIGKDGYEIIYGPAYKGIPLATSTVIHLARLNVNVSYSFNRKEVKKYGEKDNIIGSKLTGANLVIVDDVITAGTALRETIEILKNNGDPNVVGMVISVDRQEKGTGEQSAIQQAGEDNGIKVFPIVTLKEIKEYLHNNEIDGKVYLDDEVMIKLEEYKNKYGVE